MSISQILKHRANIERASQTISDSGEVTTTYNLHLEEVPCFFEKFTRSTNNNSLGTLENEVARCYFKSELALQTQGDSTGGDKVIVNSEEYILHSIMHISGNRQSLQMAELLKA